METKYTDDELLMLDPQLEAIFKKRGIPTVPTPTRDNVSHLRKGFSFAAKRFNSSPFALSALGNPSSKPIWSERDHVVPVRNGRTIAARTYTPSSPKPNGAPVLVFFHAGGWFMGDLETEAFLSRLFCSKLGLLVVDVAYGLHPEVPFAVPQTDCVDACLWVADNASSLGADLAAGFILGGNSGGCTWASVAAHLWRDMKGVPAITGCFFLAPIFTNERQNQEGEIVGKYDFATQYRSWWQCKDAPLMNDEIRLSIANLIEFDFTSKLLSPFMFPDHAGTGATYMGVCGIDPWRDGGMLYAKELEDAEIPVKVDVYPGLLHCWWTTFPQIDATTRWLNQSLAGMEWVLKTGASTRKDAKL